MSTILPENLNIADYFLENRLDEGLGERVALRLVDGNVTYRQVSEMAARFGQVLLELGVRQEERVLIALPDSAEYAGALFGILKIGAVGVMVNPHLEVPNLRAVFEYSRARAVVVHADFLATFEAAREGCQWPRVFLVVGGEAGSHCRFENQAETVSGHLETVSTHRDDPALWLFSGGTTGRPKAVVQSHGSFFNTTELYAKKTLAYGPEDITISVPKLFFGYATGSNLFFPFAVGASAVLFPERVTAEELFKQIRRHRPTILINVPTLVNHMVSHPGAGHEDLSCLRFATSAGEALPIPLYERWKEVFGVELLDGLGTAEMWHVFLTNRLGDVRPGTLGRVVEGFEIKVCDDTGAEMPDGEVGCLWAAGDSRALGYWQNLSQSADSFRGRWFVGGDLVCRDSEGYVTYCGRGDDMMKVAGRWVAPQEVESCLSGHDAVEECAVVGVENTDGLTKPYAFVVKGAAAVSLDAEPLEQELKAFVIENLAPYKHPRRVFFLDDFPRTHLGKIDRGKLRGRVAMPEE
ncbi:MAG: benzoate-CoA ligase family protein [Deltaproteobacteria bacterium]|nr:benzoate-CoA ligase family protein [Deltaproteobacteria bacterium]